jgi:hypothetical protein
MYMMIVWLLVGFVVMSVLLEIQNADEIETGIEFTPLSKGIFELGISARMYNHDNEDIEKEIRIGFMFFSIFISFFRNPA